MGRSYTSRVIPLNVAFLWHQHQPLYKSPRNGRYALPWVRLHGLKDYYDMAAIAGDQPRLHLTFNIVPSLLDQIDDYVSGQADDPSLELAKRPAADLTDDEALALLDLYFSVPYRTLIAPFPRYAALYHKRGQRGASGDYREALDRFRPDDLRDLQVWFHLAWCGATLRARPEVKELFKKGDGFTEAEKLALLDLQGRFLAEIVPIHRRLADEGVAELSTSPYYHPILPLLCDLTSAREAVPDLPLPDQPFSHPGDAAFQVIEGLSAMQRRFGRRPAGVWPSEGSLSERAIGILSECDLRWTASDEDVLRASVPGPHGPDLLYRPWRLDAASASAPAVFFRDHTLSDLIGFTYATWPAAAAVDDFLARLRHVGQRAPGGVVSVILDGENAWEHYPDNGVEFLRALYAGLAHADDIRTVTYSEALEQGPPPGRMGRLRAGSWIGASFTTWIGHPEKNRAWSLLSAARQEAERRLGSALRGAAVFHSLAAAEGSDWFWWFGDDHSSEQDAIFDASFRDLLRGVYQALDAPVPSELDAPIKRARTHQWSRPAAPLAPVLDGRVSDYFEWLAAGVCDAASGQGAMHQSAGLIRRIAYGTGDGALFLRVDPERGDVATLLATLDDGSIGVEILVPERYSVAFKLERGRVLLAGPAGGGAARHAADAVLEVELPLADPSRIEFFVTLSARDGLLQRLPRDGAIALVPGEPPDWSV